MKERVKFVGRLSITAEMQFCREVQPCLVEGFSSTGFSLWGLLLAWAKTHRLKPAPQKHKAATLCIIRERKFTAEENLKIVITDYRFRDVDQERRAVEAAGDTLVTGQAVNEEQVADFCRDADGGLTARA